MREAQTKITECDWIAISVHLCTDVVHAQSNLIRNYLKKASSHFGSIQTERGLNRLHLVVFCEIGCSVCQRFKFASAAVQSHEEEGNVL